MQFTTQNNVISRHCTSEQRAEHVSKYYQQNLMRNSYFDKGVCPVLYALDKVVMTRGDGSVLDFDIKEHKKHTKEGMVLLSCSHCQEDVYDATLQMCGDDELSLYVEDGDEDKEGLEALMEIMDEEEEEGINNTE